jgi:4-hydroxybenzoate polyprenyltransferase
MRNATDIDRDPQAGPAARPPSRLREYARLMRLDRPIGIWLLMWPVLWALWVSGGGRPDERLFVIFVIGTFVMRSAGCVINDFADREFDPQVRRTADRPLARQSVSPAEALGLFAVLALIALALVIPLNRATQVLALIGGVLAVTYPFLKRFFSLPQAYLGLAFSWSIPMAFAAQTGELPAIAWVLFVSGVLWTTAYDTMYAMVDRDDDLVIGIRSSAILFGRADRFVIGALQVGALAGLALAGSMAGLAHWYWVGLATAAALAVHQQFLIRNRDPDACFRAFLNNNLFGLAVFAGIALDYLFRG